MMGRITNTRMESGNPINGRVLDMDKAVIPTRIIKVRAKASPARRNSIKRVFNAIIVRSGDIMQMNAKAKLC